MFARLCAALCVVLMIVAAAVGQCPNGRCPLVPSAAVPAESGPPAVEVWKRKGDAAAVWRLFHGGTELGTFDADALTFSTADHVFRLAAVEQTGAKARAPADCPCDGCLCPNGVCPLACPTPAATLAVPDGGIQRDKVAPGGRGGFSHTARPVDQQTAFAALTAGTLTDDSTKLRLTVVGADADRKQVLADLKADAALSAAAADLVVAQYGPDAWQVKDLGFVAGKPSVYVQAADGTVLHRQDDYDGPAPLTGAIRKARSYDPKKDVDLRKATAGPTGPVKIDLGVLAIGAVAVYYFLLGRGRAV